eukprot:53311-Pelagomonas_calceolata.AAC.2
MRTCVTWKVGVGSQTPAAGPLLISICSPPLPLCSFNRAPLCATVGIPALGAPLCKWSLADGWGKEGGNVPGAEAGGGTAVPK